MFKKNIDIGFDVNWDKIPDDNLSKKNLKFIFDNMSPMAKERSFVINGVPIIFDTTQKDISITFSGGADSTLLLYLLCSIITKLDLKTRIHCITLMRFTEDRMYLEDVVNDVVNYMKQHFPNIEILQHMGFVPSALEYTPLGNLRPGLARAGVISEYERAITDGAHADVYAVASYSDYITRKYNIRYSYSGTTTNPEHTINEKGTPVFRNPRELTIMDLYISYMIDSIQEAMYNCIKVSPWSFIQKNWVMAQYKNLNITDLLELTRSCEGATTRLNALYGKGKWTTRGSDYVCNDCFFCDERAWGIKEEAVFLRENCE